MSQLTRRHEVDMTKGGIARCLIAFALPFLAGRMFQQLYNMVDTWVVGNFVGDEAFSAVGTVGPICNMVINAFTGFTNGAGVVLSLYFGAQDRERAEKAVHTAITLTAWMSVALTAIGMAISPAMLRMMKMPEDVFPDALLYLEIYFGGSAGLLFYNMGASILRAVGDTKRPFYFLAASAVTNTVLDLVFVICFHWDVAGVAAATLIAQFVSAVLTVAALLRDPSWVHVDPRKLKMDRDILKKMTVVAIPSAVQNSVNAFSNIYVQGYINQFGKYCMGGWTAYSKIDGILEQPISAISHAVATFVGQNLGSGEVKRARKCARTGLLISASVTLVLGTLVTVFAPQTVRFFNQTPEVVEYGTLFVRSLTLFFVLQCVNVTYSAALRGSGNTKAPMTIMLFSFVAFRQIYLFAASRIANTPFVMAMGYPAGWLLCSAIILIYYRHTALEKTRLVDTIGKKKDE